MVAKYFSSKHASKLVLIPTEVICWMQLVYKMTILSIFPYKISPIKNWSLIWYGPLTILSQKNCWLSNRYGCQIVPRKQFHWSLNRFGHQIGTGEYAVNLFFNRTCWCKVDIYRYFYQDASKWKCILDKKAM